ncbi:MAG: Holliday junction branch migration protein RuvA [Rhodospirillales bacterium]|nr:Holliday junction branch migration protein RuvA [Rhodospirillales bacterium]
MIAKLKGLIDSVGDGWTVIDVGGVGYLVFASGRTLGRLGAGDVAEVLVETHVREDHIHLYGFIDATERDWFQLLTTVQGVGAKVALALLSVLSPDDLLQAIAAADKAAITQAPGVGPKLATRILSELKDKVGDFALAGGPGGMQAADFGIGQGGVGGPIRDAASALVNLGYQRSQALGAVSRAAARLGDDAGIEALIRAGLGELASGESLGEGLSAKTGSA